MEKTTKGYGEKLQSGRQSRPPSRAGNSKQSSSKSASSNNSDRPSDAPCPNNRPIGKHDCQRKRKLPNNRSQSLPMRPPTRRKLTDMPNPVQYTSRAHSSGPSSGRVGSGLPTGKAGSGPKSRSTKLQCYGSKPAPDYAHFRNSLKHVTQEIVIVDPEHLLASQVKVPTHVEKNKPKPAPRKRHKKRDTSYKKSIAEHELLQFSLKITEDIIRNDLYTNEEMCRVFNSHMEANSERLDTDKMNKQIAHLCQHLNIPWDEVQNVPTRSQIHQARQKKTCICGPVPIPPIAKREGCECGSVRCLPLECVQHGTSTVDDAAQTMTSKEIALDHMDLESISNLDEEVIETHFFEKPESVSQASSESHFSANSKFSDDHCPPDSSTRPSRIRHSNGFLQLPSLSCVTEITEPTTSAETLDSKLTRSDVQVESVTEFEELAVLPGFGNLEVDRYSSGRESPEGSISIGKKSLKSIRSGFGSNSNPIFDSDICLEQLILLDEFDDADFASIKLSSETFKLNSESDNSISVPSNVQVMENSSQQSLVKENKRSTVEDSEHTNHSRESTASSIPVSDMQEQPAPATQPPMQIVQSNSPASTGTVQSNLSNNQQMHRTVSEPFTASASLNQQLIRSPGNKKDVSSNTSKISEKSSAGERNVEPQISKVIPLCQKRHSSQFELLEVLETSNIKVRGLNNQQEEFVLSPGCIYIPKTRSTAKKPSTSQAAPVENGSSILSKDTDGNADDRGLSGESLGTASTKSTQVSFKSTESTVSGKVSQLNSANASTSAKLNQIQQGEVAGQSVQSKVSCSTCSTSNQPERKIEQQNQSLNTQISTSSRLIQPSQGMLEENAVLKTSPTSNKSNQLEPKIAEQNSLSYTLASTSGENEEQNSSSNGFSRALNRSGQASPKGEEQTLSLKTSSCSATYLNGSCTTNQSCGNPQNQGNGFDTYSTVHESALQSIHYNSFASDISQVPEVPQTSPISESKFVAINVSGPPKIALVHNSSLPAEDQRSTEISSTPYYEQSQSLQSNRLVIEQLNDYDLTPQRDNNSGMIANNRILPFSYGNQSQNGVDLSDSLLLGDEYEIKNFGQTQSNSSCYENGLPNPICKFYPNTSTQTRSSDWLLPTAAFHKRKSETDWKGLLKGSIINFSEQNTIANDSKTTLISTNEEEFRQSFEIMFEKQEAERLQMQMEKALGTKLHHIESLNDAHRRSFDATTSDNTRMSFFMVGGEDKLSQDQLDTLTTSHDPYKDIVGENEKISNESIGTFSTPKKSGDSSMHLPRKSKHKISAEKVSNMNFHAGRDKRSEEKISKKNSSKSGMKIFEEKIARTSLNESLGKMPEKSKMQMLNTLENAEEKEKTDDEEGDDKDLLDDLDQAPSFVHRPSMMLTVTQVTNSLKKFRKGNAMEKRRSHMHREEPDGSGSVIKDQSADNSIAEEKLPFIEVKPESDIHIIIKKEENSKDHKEFTCCGLRRINKDVRRDIVDVQESVQNMPNVSAIPDEQLYMIDVRRPTNTGYGAERKSLRFDYSAMKDFNKKIDTELDDALPFEGDISRKNSSDISPLVSEETLPIARKPVITYRKSSTSTSRDSKLSKSNYLAPFGNAAIRDDSVIDILSGPPSVSAESLLLETAENAKHSTDSSDKR